MTRVTIDNEEPVFVEDDEVAVSVELDGPFSLVEEDPIDETNPVQWCNSAGVIVRDGEVQVWISTGDPRGAFTMTMRKLQDGRIMLFTPHENDTCAHEETRLSHPGALVLTRSEPKEHAYDSREAQ